MTTNNLRVVHVAPSLWPDGVGIAHYVHSLAKGRRAGSCTVLTTTHHKNVVLDYRGGMRIVRLPAHVVLHSAPTGNVPFGLVPWLRQLAATSDVIHAHLPFPALLGFAPLLRVSTPYVVTYHNEIQADLGVPRIIHYVHNLLLRRFLAQASAIIVTTTDYAAACPTLARWQYKIRPVPIGFDADAFVASLQPTPRADDLLLFVGRLTYYKGVDVLLQALARVPGARLLIVGDGPERSALQMLTYQLGLGERVMWHGYVPDSELPRLYSSATALVLPSTGSSESFGIVQLEAQACGTPLISSALPGVRTVNPEGLPASRFGRAM